MTNLIKKTIIFQVQNNKSKISEGPEVFDSNNNLESKEFDLKKNIRKKSL